VSTPPLKSNSFDYYIYLIPARHILWGESQHFFVDRSFSASHYIYLNLKLIVETYKKIGEIGRGGFSVLFEVLSRGNKKFAMKELTDNSEEGKRRFKREISLISRISHQNIISIIDKNVESEPFNFIMPLADCNLRQFLRVHRRNSNVWIFLEILNGIKVAHDNDIIHRDLKPENILLFDKGNNQYRVVISDFGLGVLVNRETTVLTAASVALGTFSYCSPEQMRNARDVDKLTDIYSLGMLFYNILSTDETSVMNLEEIPEKYRFVINKCLAQDKANRYQSVDALISDLILLQSASFSRPSDDVEWTSSSAFDGRTLTQQDIQKILITYINSIKDNSLYFDYLPKTHDQILSKMINLCPHEFETVFTAYDGFIDEGTSFDYCDTIASFYLNVFRLSNRTRIKSIIVQRLPRLGCDYNRYYVGEVVGTILSEVKDQEIITEFYNLFENNPTIANFCSSYFCGKSIPTILRKFCE
jgi:eukaryotic-like serine/threonine-protein kinase